MRGKHTLSRSSFPLSRNHNHASSTAHEFLIACGDINIQHRDEPVRVFELVKDVLDSADLRIGNMEMCLTSPRDIIPEKAGWTQSDARMVEALVSAKFDAVTNGNNVTWGPQAIMSSLKVLDEHAASRTPEAARRAPMPVPRL